MVTMALGRAHPHAKRKVSSVPATSKHDICPTMVTMLPHKVFAVFRPNDQHLRIMLADKTDSFGRLLADNNATGFLQHGTKQGTNTRRPGTDDEYSVFLGYFGDTGSPEAGGQHIAYQERLLVAYRIGNTVQSLVGIKAHVHCSAWPPSIRHPKAQPPLVSVQLFTYP